MEKKSSGLLMDIVNSLFPPKDNAEDDSSKDVLEKMQQDHAANTPITADEVAADTTLRADATNLNTTTVDLTLAAGVHCSTKAQSTAKLPASTSPATPGRPAGTGHLVL